jgi:uncharacterized Zn finger protein
MRDTDIGSVVHTRCPSCSARLPNLREHLGQPEAMIHLRCSDCGFEIGPMGPGLKLDDAKGG